VFCHREQWLWYALLTLTLVGLALVVVTGARAYMARRNVAHKHADIEDYEPLLDAHMRQ
jgi:hypothetical protein